MHVLIKSEGFFGQRAHLDFREAMRPLVESPEIPISWTMMGATRLGRDEGLFGGMASICYTIHGLSLTFRTDEPKLPDLGALGTFSSFEVAIAKDGESVTVQEGVFESVVLWLKHNNCSVLFADQERPASLIRALETLQRIEAGEELPPITLRLSPTALSR